MMIHNLFGYILYILNLIELAVILVGLLDKKKYAKICPPPIFKTNDRLIDSDNTFVL